MDGPEDPSQAVKLCTLTKTLKLKKCTVIGSMVYTGHLESMAAFHA